MTEKKNPSRISVKENDLNILLKALNCYIASLKKQEEECDNKPSRFSDKTRWLRSKNELLLLLSGAKYGRHKILRAIHRRGRGRVANLGKYLIRFRAKDEPGSYIRFLKGCVFVPWIKEQSPAALLKSAINEGVVDATTFVDYDENYRVIRHSRRLMVKKNDAMLLGAFLKTFHYTEP